MFSPSVSLGAAEPETGDAWLGLGGKLMLMLRFRFILN